MSWNVNSMSTLELADWLWTRLHPNRGFSSPPFHSDILRVLVKLFLSSSLVIYTLKMQAFIWAEWQSPSRYLYHLNVRGRSPMAAEEGSPCHKERCPRRSRPCPVSTERRPSEIRGQQPYSPIATFHILIPVCSSLSWTRDPESSLECNLTQSCQIWTVSASLQANKLKGRGWGWGSKAKKSLLWP